MQYMIIERFKPGAAQAIYERARMYGRMLPPGLEYVDSWVSQDIDVCFQLMTSDDPRHIDDWMACWSDLVDFEVTSVISSKEAAMRVAQL